MKQGSRVAWAGSPHWRPGTVGTVEMVAHHDINSLRVLWDDRPKVMGQYTWERRKNLKEEQ